MSFTKHFCLTIIFITFILAISLNTHSCWPKPKVIDISSPIIDLTHNLSSSIPHSDDQHVFKLHDIANKKNHNLNWFEIDGQNGTYISAPDQSTKNNITIENLNVQNLVAPAAIIDITSKCRKNADYMISKKDIERWEKNNGKIPDGAIVIGYTGWQARWDIPKRYLNKGKDGRFHYPGFNVEAVQFLIKERNIKAIGIDTLGVDLGQSNLSAVLLIMNKAGKYVIGNLTNLDKLPATNVVIIALPMKIEKAGSAPARVIAIVGKK